MAIKRMQMYRKNLDTSETNLYPLTEAQYVSMENGQTVQEILSDRDSDKYTPVITNSSSTFKVGQGDNVDLSSSMKEGAYDSCVLKGKTMVNCIQEPSSQDIVLPYEFEDGQYVTINDTKESGALGVELKGQTLINLSFPHDEREIIFNSRYQIYNTTNDVVKGGLKNGEKIFMSMEVNIHEVNIETPNFRAGTCRGTGGYDHITKTNAEICNLPKNTWVRLCTIREVKEEESSEQYSFWFGMRGEHPTTDKEQIARVSFRNPVWINLTSIFGSGKEPTLTECEKLPYFTGMSSCKMPILHTIGKNLFDGEIELGSLNVNSGEPTSTTTEIRSKNFTPINGTPFIFSRTDSAGSLAMRYYDINKNYLGAGDGGMGAGQTSRICTPPTNARYVKFKDMTANLSQKVQIEYNTSATTYEPYKSSILSLPEEVVLRSLPNGVCDTFNTRTGVYTQRIGELVFDGSDDEDWRLLTASSNWVNFSPSVCTFVFPKPSNCALTWGRGGNENSYLTNKFPAVPSTDPHAKEDKEKLMFDSTNIKMAILKTSLKTEDVEGLRIWLSQNPIVTQYELATPIITKINLPSTLKSWNTTTHIYSEIPENSLYPILSHSNPSYPVILKPSTKYSIVANSYSNSHTNSTINFNLGGATASTTVGNRVTTVTTPSTLSNELLTMSGRGNKLNNVMVIEGDVVGDEPYFEGICDCKSPILLNIGKNLFDANEFKRVFGSNVEIGLDGTIVSLGDIKGGNHNLGFHSPINIALKPNTKYTLCLFNLNTSGQIIRVEGCLSTCNSELSMSNVAINSVGYKVFTTNSQNYKDGVSFKVVTGATTGEKAQYQIMIVEGEVSHETYSPYKSNTTTFNQKDGKTIVLRSLPNGVCDTLNVETGEYVQRIGEVILDGTKRFGKNMPESEYNKPCVRVSCTNALVNGSSTPNFNMKADKIAIGGYSYNMNYPVMAGLHEQALYIYIPRTIIGLATNDNDAESIANAFNSWLTQNPITVQYPLATPIVSTIDVQGFPYAYTSGHVQLTSGHSGQSLTPKVEYSLSANKTGQIDSNTRQVVRQQKQLDDFEAMMLTSMVQSAYDKAILQFDYEMQMMSLGGE